MIHSAPKVHESSIAAEQVPFLLVHVALWDLSLELELVNGVSDQLFVCFGDPKRGVSVCKQRLLHCCDYLGL